MPLAEVSRRLCSLRGDVVAIGGDGAALQRDIELPGFVCASLIKRTLDGGPLLPRLSRVQIFKK